jgi:hypothetical protein
MASGILCGLHGKVGPAIGWAAGRKMDRVRIFSHAVRGFSVFQKAGGARYLLCLTTGQVRHPTLPEMFPGFITTHAKGWLLASCLHPQARFDASKP